MVTHLCTQDFAGKLGSLRKALKSRAELIFIEAPHAVDADQSISETCVDGPRAWWTWQASFRNQLLVSDMSPASCSGKQCVLIDIQTPPGIHLVMPLCASELGKCYQDPDVAGRPSLASTYTGVEASLKVATDALSEHQPIDGLLGRHSSCMHA